MNIEQQIEKARAELLNGADVKVMFSRWVYIDGDHEKTVLINPVASFGHLSGKIYRPQVMSGNALSGIPLDMIKGLKVNDEWLGGKA